KTHIVAGAQPIHLMKGRGHVQRIGEHVALATEQIEREQQHDRTGQHKATEFEGGVALRGHQRKVKKGVTFGSFELLSSSKVPSAWLCPSMSMITRFAASFATFRSCEMITDDVPYLRC